MDCPWYISAAAVRRWQAIDRSAPRDFDAASDRLIQIAAEVWATRYADGTRQPQRRRDGDGAVYEAGRAHGRIRLVVATGPRPEGEKPQVVDVLARHG